MSEFTDATRQLARVGYEAYGHRAEWKNYAGDPMPQWEVLRPDIIEKWCAAVEAIADALADIEDEEDDGGS